MDAEDPTTAAARTAERIWHEAAAAVDAELWDETVAEAFEVYRAERARTRLTDHCGTVDVMLASGARLRGELIADPSVVDCLTLVADDGWESVIPVTAILTVRGGKDRLRPEETGARPLPMPLTSWLRDREGSALLLHLRDGSHSHVTCVAVGADHVVVGLQAEQAWVPFSAVQAWCVRT